MNRLHRICMLGAVCALLHSPLALAAEDKVTLNFVNADIEAVIKAVGQITGKNFLIDPRVKGNINIISATPIAGAATYDVLLSALRVQGFTAVESGGIVKILPEAEGKLQGGPVVSKGKQHGDRIVTQVFPLKYETATLVMPLVRPLVGPNNNVVASASANALVVTDYADNLKRIEKLLAEIDQPSAAVPYVIPVRYASALDLNQMLSKLFADSAGNAADGKNSRVSIVPDMRTNSLIVRSDSLANLERVRSLVESLDKEIPKGGNIHIVYLKNAEATRVAQTLRAIFSGETQTATTASAPTATSSNTSTATSASTSTLQSASPSSVAVPVQGGMIQADSSSNALIITAPEPVYNNLRVIIDKLDVRRAQVHVEALIVEVTADKAAEFGIQWQDLSGINNGGTNIISGTNFGARSGGTNIIDTATNIGTAGAGLNVGIVRGKINLPGLGTILNLGMLARALESDSNANILSTPNLLTLDNEEARIVIGQNVPFITGQYAQTGSSTTPTPFQTIERRDVGLTLRIKPQISEGGSIRLQIFQEVSSVQDKTNSAGVITNKRSIESTVLVDDAQIIALGGLVQDAVTDGVDKVPGFGDIPVLGQLFKTETRKRTKTNLMVFLRPTILRDAKSYADLTDQRYRYIMGEQSAVTPKPHAILPDMESPRLQLSPGVSQPAAKPAN